MNEVITHLEQIAGTGASFMADMTVLIISIIIGLIIGLFGLKLARVWAAFVGFILGAAAGGGIAEAAGLKDLALAGAVLGGAVVLAVLACIFYKIGIFFYMIFMVAGICMAVTRSQSLPIIGISLILGLVIAIITVKVFDPLVIIVTSIGGGFMAGNALVSMLGLGKNLIAVIGIPLVLIGICIFVQFIMRSRQVGKKQAENAGKLKEQDSRETEVEKARRLLGDGDMEMDSGADDDVKILEEDGYDDYDEELLDDDGDLSLDDDEDFRILE